MSDPVAYLSKQSLNLEASAVDFQIGRAGETTHTIGQRINEIEKMGHGDEASRWLILTTVFRGQVQGGLEDGSLGGAVGEEGTILVESSIL